ncbi:MAG TPA: dihydrolipoamide acetyltransferase family protein, partial [Solirubrobacteraceae bacterium]|nr:dihydrolipoamide acetyltransferase family protein [Solirubrobacteraceae bacterium]
ATVDTSKAEIDIEIFQDGVIEQVLVDAGEKVPVGAVLATVKPIGAPAPVVAEPPAAVAAAAEPPAEPAVERHLAGPRPLASPLARRTAAERGIALAEVDGSGPGGAVLGADLDRAPDLDRTPDAAGPPAEPAPDRAASMRQAIAAAMARSKREIPHYYLATTIDVTALLDWLAAHNAELPVRERLLPAACTLKAVALAARKVPALNGFWQDGALREAGTVNAGVAIALRGGGLIAPAIHDADHKPLDQLMRELRDLVARTRGGGLRSSEMTDATITVTSLGDRGAESVFGVIYPPQVALVGFGAVTERAVARGGLVGARSCMTATLAADHRATDGHQGSAFLSEIDRLLQTPEQL